MSELRLRPLRLDDEKAVGGAQEVMAATDNFEFALFYTGQSWSDYLSELDVLRAGIGLPPQRVASSLLVAEIDHTIVGRSSIRHTLNDRLKVFGGHIGYGVLPAHRRNGYATEILRQSLVITRSLGIDRAMLTCNDDNVGSVRAIEACGGQLDAVNGPDEYNNARWRRYWIP